MEKFGLNLTEENIKDILTTAIEGGIGYWCGLDNTTAEWKQAFKACSEKIDHPCYDDIIFQMLITGESVKFYDVEDENDVFYLTLENFCKGCLLYEEKYGSICTALDNASFDADDADIIIQLSLFNEVVYG